MLCGYMHANVSNAWHKVKTAYRVSIRDDVTHLQADDLPGSAPDFTTAITNSRDLCFRLL